MYVVILPAMPYAHSVFLSMAPCDGIDGEHLQVLRCRTHSCTHTKKQLLDANRKRMRPLYRQRTAEAVELFAGSLAIDIAYKRKNISTHDASSAASLTETYSVSRQA